MLPFQDDKKGSLQTPETLDDEEIMGKTMMDIDVGEGGDGKSDPKKNDSLKPDRDSGESVEALLKKEKSFLNKIGLGKLFEKKKG